MQCNVCAFQRVYLGCVSLYSYGAAYRAAGEIARARRAYRASGEIARGNTQISNDRVDKKCVCNIIKDNCNNYVKTGKIVYGNKNDSGNPGVSDDDCMEHIGATVDCNHPEIRDYN